MSSVERLDASGTEAAQTAYFRDQVERNLDEEPGELADRKAAMAQHLGAVGNAFWRSSYAYGAARIFVAGPGLCLEPKSSSSALTLEYRLSTGEQVTTGGQRRFNWAVAIEPSLVPGKTAFEDTETGRIGEYRTVGQRSYYDFRTENGVLAELEENLSSFFFPGSDARQRPESPQQYYNVVASSLVRPLSPRG